MSLLRQLVSKDALFALNSVIFSPAHVFELTLVLDRQFLREALHTIDMGTSSVRVLVLNEIFLEQVLFFIGAGQSCSLYVFLTSYMISSYRKQA